MADEYNGSWNAVLGELQLSFLLLLYVSSLAALEQWKKMVALLAASIPALEQSLVAPILDVLEAQLRRIPSDFFADVVSSSNFLGDALATACDQPHSHAAVATFRAFLVDRFGDALALPDDPGVRRRTVAPPR